MCCSPLPLVCCPAVFTSSVGKETTIAVALLCVWPIIIEVGGQMTGRSAHVTLLCMLAVILVLMPSPSLELLVLRLVCMLTVPACLVHWGMQATAEPDASLSW
jgi:hypothetical protein